MYDTFDNTYQATIGIDFLSKAMYLEDLQQWPKPLNCNWKTGESNFIKLSISPDSAPTLCVKKLDGL